MQELFSLFIKQGVNKVFPRIMSTKTSKEAWEILKKQFQGYDKVISIKLQSLWKEFDNLQMKESEIVSDFFSKVSTITNQIISYGDTLEDKKIVMKVLRSLAVKFEHMVYIYIYINILLTVIRETQTVVHIRSHTPEYTHPDTHTYTQILKRLRWRQQEILVKRLRWRQM